MKIEDLLNKYPKIFIPYEGNPRMINYLDIPQMWIPIIDDLCACIQNYIDDTQIYVPNPDYIKDSKYSKDDVLTHPTIKTIIPQLVCFQVKEKFGELRFYTNAHDDRIEGMIKYAEHLCWYTCIRCGSREEIMTKSGWIERICKKCLNK